MCQLVDCFGGSSRTVGRKTERLLNHRARTYHGEDRPVFASRVGTELFPQTVRSRVLDPATQSVGLGRVGFHAFRHTCASLLFEAGRNVKQVSAWLGHADPGFTLRTYVHLMDEGVGDAAFLDGAVQVKVGSREGPQTAAGERTTERAKTFV